MQRLPVFLSGLLVLLSFADAAEVAYTQRAHNYIREGPGSYFTLLAVVPEHTAVTIQEKKEPWLKVRLSDTRSGWMSANSLTAAKPPAARVVPVENVWSSPKASRAGVSAAIRGFAEKRGKTPPGSVETVLGNAAKTFGEKELATFIAPLLPFREAVGGRLTFEDLDLGPMVYDAGIEEQQVGVGVAARLVARGFITDRSLLAYANMICATLARQSPAYDWDFTVFILDEPTVNGFALPGGYIFLTRGALAMCSDESELAAMVAHEMAHVIRRHGVQEMSKRKVHMKADDAFNELEEELGEKDPEEAEMDDLVEKTYESIIAPRLFAYEKEADRVAAVLLAACGYDPFGLVRIDEKVARMPREKPTMFDPGYLSPDDLVERAKFTRAFVQEHFSGATGGARMADRFARIIAGAR